MRSSPLASQPPYGPLAMNEIGSAYPAVSPSLTTEETLTLEPQTVTLTLAVSPPFNDTAQGSCTAAPGPLDLATKPPAAAPPPIRKTMLQGLAPHLFPTLLIVDPILKRRAEGVCARRRALNDERLARAQEIAGMESVLDPLVKKLAQLEVLCAQARVQLGAKFAEIEAEYEESMELAREMVRAFKDRLLELVEENIADLRLRMVPRIDTVPVRINPNSVSYWHNP
ncbi:hypothetical protein C8F04DRAFT_1268852 [Mycena alexandri]|uniref:Uncharacterized protein n=1 Tax=Mycena alexandri TaxID=1745969 RepID=A0AAD6SEU2_9AGAR|nr:hypothetical protein C8F04DRAFT_1268852 [Mycena alexandri]